VPYGILNAGSVFGFEVAFYIVLEQMGILWGYLAKEKRYTSYYQTNSVLFCSP